MKRDVIPHIRTPRISEAICRCQIIELCCHWHSFNRVINRRSIRDDCGPENVSVPSVLICRGGIDSARMVLRMGLERLSKSRQKSVGETLAVFLVSDLDRCQVVAWQEESLEVLGDRPRALL